jgi:hypothetical protein
LDVTGSAVAFVCTVVKTGIWRAEDLDRARTILATHRALAYSLLRLPETTDEKAIRQFETVIKTVRLSSGSCRTTHPERLSDVDAEVQPILESLFPRDAPLAVYDWGASDALVSSEWADLLLAKYPRLEFTASDSILWLTEATHEQGEVYVLEPDGTPIQYVNPPFVISLYHRERIFYPLNMIARKWGARAVESLKLAASEIQWRRVPEETVWKQPPWSFRQIPLIHPRALSFARQHPNFRITQHDAFTESAEKCDILRAMNLFNPRVFTPENLRRGIQAAFNSLKEGGVFIFGQTNTTAPFQSDVSIFRRIGGKCAVIGRLANGSELQDLTLETTSASLLCE